MSGAIETHGVTVSDVVGRTPLAEGTVTETSAGLNTSRVKRWIQQGASTINSLLGSKNRDPSNLSDNEALLVASAIEAFGEWKVLRAREYDDQADHARDEWQDAKREIRDLPKTMENHDPGSRIGHSSSDARPRWDSDNFGGW